MHVQFCNNGIIANDSGNNFKDLKEEENKSGTSFEWSVSNPAAIKLHFVLKHAVIFKKKLTINNMSNGPSKFLLLRFGILRIRWSDSIEGLFRSTLWESYSSVPLTCFSPHTVIWMLSFNLCPSFFHDNLPYMGIVTLSLHIRLPVYLQTVSSDYRHAPGNCFAQFTWFLNASIDRANSNKSCQWKWYLLRHDSRWCSLLNISVWQQRYTTPSEGRTCHAVRAKIASPHW